MLKKNKYKVKIVNHNMIEYYDWSKGSKDTASIMCKYINGDEIHTKIDVNSRLRLFRYTPNIPVKGKGKPIMVRVSKLPIEPIEELEDVRMKMNWLHREGLYYNNLLVPNTRVVVDENSNFHTY